MRPPSRSHRLWAVKICLAALVVSACAGPRPDLAAGIREFPSTILIGVVGAEAPPVPMPPVIIDVPTFLPPPPRIVFLPPPPPPPPPPTTVPVPELCPTADPRTPARFEAPAQITMPPVEATYEYRTAGAFSVSGADAREGVFPETSTRTVSNTAIAADGSITYDVTTTLGDQATTTSYRVVPAPPPSPVPIVDSPDAGLFITKVLEVRDGQESTFAPQPPMKLLALPARVSETWEVDSVDPTSGTSMRYRGTIQGKARVDACGEPLDSWEVIVDGALECVTQPPLGRVCAPASPAATTAQPTRQEVATFNAIYRIGTQFGGLSLSDEVHSERAGSSGQIITDLLSTVSVVPLLEPTT